MKTMYRPGYHYNGFVATHPFGHIIYVFHDIHDFKVPQCMNCHKAIVLITGRAHCFHDCIYIYIYKYTYIHTCVCIYGQVQSNPYKEQVKS